ncbi:MAG: ATP-grasp domain-containing protein [Clostridia bacterium]|nr:ATP-grasp domain-containing protein [Clostridia bacterium]
MQITGKIVAVDASDSAPALYFADKHYLVPRIASDEYIEKLIEICNQEDIDLIVPTIDTELEKLARFRNEIESKTKAMLLLSDDRVVSVCRNKTNTQRFFEEHGFYVPRLITKEDIEQKNYSFPLFIKPLDGSSSVNTFKVENDEQLMFFVKYIKNPMVQEFMQGEEYSVDVFCDFNCKPITVVPRKRLAVRSGEIAKGEIVKDRRVIDDVLRLIDVLRPIGHITIQCMKTQKGIEYIEINPRFGGGAPMSIAAGADSCENLYRLLSGEELSYHEDYQERLLFLRFDKSIVLQKDESMQ